MSLSQWLPYLVAGLALGSIYSLAASSLVITYTATGIMNFAFGSEAYFIARLYYFLNSQHQWSIAASAAICILVASPLMGIALYFLLFRYLRLASSLVKVATTIGLSVALPALAVLCFGNPTINSTPGLAPLPVRQFQIFGTAVSMDQVITFACIVLIALGGWIVIRTTDIGLTMRAMVDSPALTALSGTGPARVSIVVWAVSTALAGLTGILVGPTVGLSSPTNYTLLIVSAFAAVIAANLRYVGRAVWAGILLGLLGGVVEAAVPSDSVWSSAALSATPFVLTAAFVLYYAISGRGRENASSGAVLDRALQIPSRELQGVPAVSERQPAALNGSGTQHGLGKTLRRFRGAAPLLVLLLLPLVLQGVWVAVIGLGFAYGVVFLSITVITGDGGMVSLCQITFAAIGAVTTAQLATMHHWPVLLALLAAGLVAVPFGLLIGLLSLVLGNLYLALVTLTFGVLMDNLVFTLHFFSQDGSGVVAQRPEFASSDQAFAYFVLFIFALFALFVRHVRRSTPGLGVAAVKWSENGARATGVSVLQMKLLLTGIATFIAGVGGALLALSNNNASPTSYLTIEGLVWLAVVVAIGSRSIIGAIVAGISFAVVPFVFNRYLPLSFAQVPTLLFGLGALIVAKYPDGLMDLHARQIRHVYARLKRQKTPAVGEIERIPTADHAMYLEQESQGVGGGV
jgi:branched-chain amino acid transport system permease protein